MNEASRKKFISQCVAQDPCVGKNTIHCKIDEKGNCHTCKRRLAEIKGWETDIGFEEREKICKELLDR